MKKALHDGNACFVEDVVVLGQFGGGECTLVNDLAVLDYSFGADNEDAHVFEFDATADLGIEEITITLGGFESEEVLVEFDVHFYGFAVHGGHVAITDEGTVLVSFPGHEENVQAKEYKEEERNYQFE